MNHPVRNLQQLALSLVNYWVERDCVWSQPYDMPVGAGTFHPHTFLRGIGPEPWRSVYVQPCRRPVDGRYGESPYRFQHYYQLQVLLKPAPADIVDVFLKSLESVGISLKEHDIGLLEDDWKGPTLGAWGLGWEVRANGQEITQFTYFQQLGGMDVDVVCGEITYGLERLFMYATGAKNGLEIPYNDRFTYGDVFKQNEFEFSHYNFKQANTQELLLSFSKQELEVARLIECGLVLPAYDAVLAASHLFNLLDARGALSAGERQRYIGRVRECARSCAELYRAEREKLGFPMRDRLPVDGRLPTMPQVLSVHSGREFSAADSEATKPVFKTAESDELLIELGVEELPPAFQKTIHDEGKQFSAVAFRFLQQFSSSKTFLDRFKDSKPVVEVSQRRIVLHWKSVARATPQSDTEVWGPAERIAFSDGNLTPAGLGFCKKNSIDPAAVSLKEKDGTKFLFVSQKKESVYLPSLLVELFEDWLCSLPSPLKMRWLPADVSEAFVRPVRWILALFGNEVVPLSKSKFGLSTGRKTCGQRIQSPEFESISSPQDYFAFLDRKGIVLSFTDRVRRVEEQSRQVLIRAGLSHAQVKPDDALLMKCAGLSETPHVFIGKFPEAELRLPAELVSSVLRDHMNSFAVESFPKAGETPAKSQAQVESVLLPYFVGIANYEPKDLAGMTSAAEQVVIGRLADGSFYFDTDLQTAFDTLQEKLERQVFQDGLGSLADKTRRLAELVKYLSAALTGFSPELLTQALAATALSKIDLQTGCVTEFPDEMQGVMGGKLILNKARQGEVVHSLRGEQVEGVAEAVAFHYSPKNSEDGLPPTFLGKLLAFCDKWDTVATLMSRGDRVKGNKDPFGIRRNTLAVLRLVGALGEPETLPLRPQDLIECARLSAQLVGKPLSPELETELSEFVMGRLSASLKERFQNGAVEAVCRYHLSSLTKGARSKGARSKGVGLESSLTFAQSFELAKNIDSALKDESSSFSQALASYKRARNIVEKSGLRELVQGLKVESTFFESDAEARLLETVSRLKKQAAALISQHDFSGYLEALALIQPPLADFFESVMVNALDEQTKLNRLALLSAVLELYESFADFSVV